MLLNLSKKAWTSGLSLGDFGAHGDANGRVVSELKSLAERYDKAVVEELEQMAVAPEKRAVANVGRLDAKKHLQATALAAMSSNIIQAMGTMLDTVVF